MSIRKVVTRGFGDFGSIPDVVTRGYLPSYTEVYFPRVTLTGTGTMSPGASNMEFSGAAITITGEGTLEGTRPRSFVRVRDRPLKSKAFRHGNY